MKNKVESQYIINSNFSLQAEAYSRVQINIDYANVDKKIKKIAVTSAHQNEGKSTTAANLAKLYALKGFKTILVDLDLRKPTINRIFNLDNAYGITDFCLNPSNKNKLIKKVDGLDVITAGTKTSFPTNVLQSEKIKVLFKELDEIYDYIIVDTPPILVVADGIIVSDFVDGFIAVVVSNKTKKTDVKEIKSLFEKNNMNLIGGILTRVKLNKKYVEGYNYYSKR